MILEYAIFRTLVNARRLVVLYNLFMVLSDRDIRKAIADGRIVITPKPDFSTQLDTCTLDLRLGNIFRVFEHSKHAYIDPSKKDYSNEITKKVVVKKGEDFIMQPGDFVLAVTAERVKLADDIMGRLEGRSSLGRLGIVVHSTASIFHAGWDGNCVLELGNLGRMAVRLSPGMRICAMSFEELSSAAEVPYYNKKSAKYKIQKEPTESRYHQDQ